MDGLRSKKGLSVIELGSIVGIIVLVLVIVFGAVQYYCNGVYRGNDKINMETASSVARMNRADSLCVVTGCNGDKSCTHKTPEGTYIGYYDEITGHINGMPGEGYNQYHKMTVGDKIYEGKKGTMVIMAKADGSKLTLSWIRANQRQ